MDKVKGCFERLEVLKSMDTLIRYLNNEEAYYLDWINIIPDSSDDEELLDIVIHDPATFEDAVFTFARIFPRYYKDGGLFVGGLVYEGK